MVIVDRDYLYQCPLCESCLQKYLPDVDNRMEKEMNNKKYDLYDTGYCFMCHRLDDVVIPEVAITVLDINKRDPHFLDYYLKNINARTVHQLVNFLIQSLMFSNLSNQTAPFI